MSNLSYRLLLENLKEVSRAIESIRSILEEQGLKLMVAERSKIVARGSVKLKEESRKTEVPVFVSVFSKENSIDISIDVLDPPKRRLPSSVCDKIAEVIAFQIYQGIHGRKPSTIKFTSILPIRKSKIRVKRDKLHIMKVYCG